MIRSERKWHKALKSGSNGGACLIVGDRMADGTVADVVLVEDTKNRDAGTLAFPRARWIGFLAGMKAGEFTKPE